MKCPKCQYLGFETGDRCRNCGYDFSLLTVPAAVPDLPLHDTGAEPAGPNAWLDQLRHDPELAEASLHVATESSPARFSSVPDPLAPLPLDTVVAAPPAAATAATAAGAPRAARRAAAPPLPLFQPGEEDDQPLIKMPAAPRAPLAVRRTPEAPKLRTVAKPPRVVPRGPALQFAEDRSGTTIAPALHPARIEVPSQRSGLRRHEEVAPAERMTCGPGRRLLAAGLDHAILLGIDAVVVYFTLKMAGLAPEQWTALPVAPLAAFLAMIKAAYFCAFTLVGGQTIGKMAARIRVVGDDRAALDPARAVQRTFAGAVSMLTLGLGFAPIVLSPDRRALHDRLARTRVVAE